MKFNRLLNTLLAAMALIGVVNSDATAQSNSKNTVKSATSNSNGKKNSGDNVTSLKGKKGGNSKQEEAQSKNTNTKGGNSKASANEKESATSLKGKKGSNNQKEATPAKNTNTKGGNSKTSTNEKESATSLKGKKGSSTQKEATPAKNTNTKGGNSKTSANEKESATSLKGKKGSNNQKEATPAKNTNTKGGNAKASGNEKESATSLKGKKGSSTQKEATPAKNTNTKGGNSKASANEKEAATSLKGKNGGNAQKDATPAKNTNTKGGNSKETAPVSNKSNASSSQKNAANNKSIQNSDNKNVKQSAVPAKSNQSSADKKTNNAISSGNVKNKKTDNTPQKQESPKNLTASSASNSVVNTDSLKRIVDRKIANKANTSGAGVKSINTDSKSKSIDIELTEKFTEIPVTQEFIDNLEKEVGDALPDPIASYRIYFNVGNRPLSYYVTKVDRVNTSDSSAPFVIAKEPYVHATKGMEGDIVALWHSHGRYYKNTSWQWQRPFLFETAEDVYTMSYILPYVVPMLENAGAYVLLPRERDPNKNEVIVDNDTNPGGMLFSQPYYKEETGHEKWHNGEKEGFIYDLPDFRDTENPFEGGTYRETKTIKSGKASKAGWFADIPEDGEYAVYVSYKSLPNSTEDAHYTVHYSGGSREFYVNQKMGGGTWVYLGTFPLEAGYSDTEPIVTLDNISKKGAGKILTADAVKIGGGMGNIARSPSRSDVTNNPSKGLNDVVEYSDDEFDGAEAGPDTKDTYSKASKSNGGRFTTSGMPRFVEGARYWLHWAGFPEYVYSPYHGKDDYKDDYTGRGHWVNYLAGGSRVLPNKPGLGIPVDVAMALHSDAGVRKDDSVVGTLGIYYTNGGARYADGTSRSNSRNLTDMMMSQIVADIRAQYEPNWTRRSMWDKSYLEARVPEVPTTLIELMSHQNFKDMQYGLDPNFRFTVGRAIYKALARFVGQRKGRQVVIQPLPVNDFAIQRVSKGHYKLSWEPTPDPLEPTAKAEKYVILERTGGNLGFRKIAETKNTSFELKVTDHEVHSFKIIAANAGGLSFPSEVLALRESPKDNKPLLVVNGFTRISGPESFSDSSQAGFRSEDDFGVPYIRDISFSGHQKNFNRNSGNSWGVSNTNYVTEVIAGNTFDFVSEHGISLAEAGNGFVSCSLKAIETGKVKLSNYPLVDLVLGKQKTTVVGNGKSGENYRVFPPQLQQALRSYVEAGGHLLVSGAYVASDLLSNKATQDDEGFAYDILGIDYDGASSKHNGRVTLGNNKYTYSNTLNDKQYIVEKPDDLQPVNGATSIMKFGDDNTTAGVFHNAGKGKVLTLSVPFESIQGEDARDAMMKELLRKFSSK